MTVIADNKHRVTIPAKPGDRFDVQAFGNEKFILTKLEPIQRRPAKVTATKKNGFTVYRTNQEISLAAIKEVLNEFP